MKKRILTASILLMAGMLAGCGNENAQGEAPQTQRETERDTQQSSAAPEQEEAGDTQTEAVSEQGFSFADVADLEFYFSSGAGGWYTVLYIHEDGSFDGHYQDSDLGVTDADYPNGTIFYSEFSGNFTAPEKVNETTYVFQIESIEYPYGFGEEIKDGYLFNYCSAYGLDDTEDIYIYLPGTQLADLPEEYLSWVGYYDLANTTETGLPFYGLYNVKEEEGFSSYKGVDAAGEIESEIEMTEKNSAELQEKLQNAQTQAEMNEISGEIYKMWDDTLNVIWGIIKEELDEETMVALTNEEREWIVKKEAAVKAAGAEYEGGSMQALVENQKAAEMTQERVYELSEMMDNR